MNTKALNALADVVCRAQEQDRTPMGIAFAVDSAGLHMSPETAAELESLRSQLAALLAEREADHRTWQHDLRTARGEREATAARAAGLEAELLTLNTQRGDVGQLIERERGHGEECVDIDALESALGLGSDEAEESCDHPNGYGPNGCAGCGAFKPADGEDDVRPQVRKLQALLAGQRAQAGGAS